MSFFDKSLEYIKTFETSDYVIIDCLLQFMEVSWKWKWSSSYV